MGFKRRFTRFSGPMQRRGDPATAALYSAPMQNSLGRNIVPRLALVALAGLLLAGCNSLIFHPSGGGAGEGACLPGTWKLDTEQLSTPISTPIGDITLKASGEGTSMTFTDSAWSLHADMTLSASLKTEYATLSGSIIVKGDASGTYTSDGTKITFKLEDLSGTAAYDVNLLGYHLAGSMSLPSSGGLEGLVGLHGTADYTCSPDALAFTLAPLTVHAHH
jgi:hypothetical protein